MTADPNRPDATPRRPREPDEHIDKHDDYDVAGLHAPIVRERAEPKDGYEPIPSWLAGAFGVVVFWCGFYTAEYSGDFSVDRLDGDFRPLGRPVEKKAENPVALGGRLFAAQGCVSCHQASGKGVPGQYPPLAGSEWVEGSPARLARILIHGLQGPVKVAGSTYNGNMPSFGAKLKDDQIAAVLTYIRQEWGNKADAVSADVVDAARQAVKDRNSPFTAEELEAVKGEDKVSHRKDAGDKKDAGSKSEGEKKDDAKTKKNAAETTPDGDRSGGSKP